MSNDFKVLSTLVHQERNDTEGSRGFVEHNSNENDQLQALVPRHRDRTHCNAVCSGMDQYPERCRVALVFLYMRVWLRPYFTTVSTVHHSGSARLRAAWYVGTNTTNTTNSTYIQAAVSVCVPAFFFIMRACTVGVTVGVPMSLSTAHSINNKHNNKPQQQRKTHIFHSTGVRAHLYATFFSMTVAVVRVQKHTPSSCSSHTHTLPKRTQGVVGLSMGDTSSFDLVGVGGMGGVAMVVVVVVIVVFSVHVCVIVGVDRACACLVISIARAVRCVCVTTHTATRTLATQQGLRQRQVPSTVVDVRGVDAFGDDDGKTRALY